MGDILRGSPLLGRPSIDRVIVLVTDRGYLCQSLIAASQIASQPDVVASADILIFLVDIPEDERKSITQAIGGENFNFISLDSATFVSESTDKLPPLHVPRATLGRLVTEEMLPAHYKHIVYLDGDIQILRSIAHMVKYTVPEDRLLTACDRLDHGGQYNSPKWYMRQLHVPGPAHYFNAGIIAASRSAWRHHSRAAIDFLVNNPEKCKHHDQSALNAVNAGRRDVLSPEYNFNSWFKEAGVDDLVRPRLVHFTGKMKPWNSTRGPWGTQYRRVYEDLLKYYPFFARYMTLTTNADPLPAGRISKARAKLVAKTIASRLSRIRQRGIARRYLGLARFADLTLAAPLSRNASNDQAPGSPTTAPSSRPIQSRQ